MHNVELCAAFSVVAARFVGCIDVWLCDSYRFGWTITHPYDKWRSSCMISVLVVQPAARMPAAARKFVMASLLGAFGNVSCESSAAKKQSPVLCLVVNTCKRWGLRVLGATSDRVVACSN